MSRKRLTHEDVEGRLEGRGIYWAGRYKDSVTRVEFGCEECGHEWKAMPGSIFTGSGCPRCFSEKKRGGKGVGRPKYRGVNKVMEDHGDWLVIDISTEKERGKTMLVDKVKYEGLRGRIGRIGSTVHGYAICRIDGKARLFHRILLHGVKEVDHVNGDKLDNRMVNLRSVESWQNQANRGARRNNRLGVLGVSWKEGRKRYYAQHKFRGVIVCSSYHKTLEEAKKAREESMRKHCGKYAPISV